MRILRVVAVSLSAYTIAFGAFSDAATITKIDSKDGKTRINLDGEVAPGDVEKIRDIIKSANDAGRIVATIRLNSAGGNLLEAVRLAEIIRYAKTATAVLSGATCGKDVLVRVAKDSSGELKSREVCVFNEFKDVRTCLNWDTGKKHRDMQNNNGKWYKVSDE